MHVCLEGWLSHMSTGALRSQWISSSAMQLEFLLAMRCTKWVLEMNHDHKKLSYLLSHHPSFFLKQAVIGAEIQIWLKCGRWGMMEGSAIHKTSISPPSNAQKMSQEMGWEQCKNLRRGR